MVVEKQKLYVVVELYIYKYKYNPYMISFLVTRPDKNGI